MQHPMSRLLLAFLPLALASFPTPPEWTKEQTSLFTRTQAAAKEASDAATPKVLDFFDSAEFRRVLQDCCPDAAGLPSQELLKRYRAEAQIAELAHALPAKKLPSGAIFDDLTEAELGSLAWFPNEWQTAIMHNVTARSAPINDWAQQHVFGSAPFAGTRPTWSEAGNRLIYIAHNMRRVDTGSLPDFGDVSVVFNTSHVRNAVVIAPYDTGLVTMNCLNLSLLAPMAKRALNCSAWTSVIGTLDHLDHLIMPNLQVGYNSSATNKTWADAARALWSRAFSKKPYEDLPGLTEDDMSAYLEADILANPRLPHAVKYVVGNFALHFGSESGRQLQRIAAKRSWPLFWALGYGEPYKSQKKHLGTFPGNQRFADPSVAALTNASIPWSALRTFEKVWADVQQERLDHEVTKADVKRWLSAVAPSQLMVAPLSSSSCADADRCVAVAVASSDCVCISDKQILTV